MGEAISIDTRDGAFSAYVARPDAAEPPAIVVIQEIFGVNAVMRDICDAVARAGYLAVCPDLFWRIEPGVNITDKAEAEWKRAFDLFGTFDKHTGIEDMKATLAAAQTLPGCNGKAGTIGCCLGGMLAFMMAEQSDSDVNISYYGVGLDGLLQELHKVSRPLIVHIAD